MQGLSEKIYVNILQFIDELVMKLSCSLFIKQSAFGHLLYLKPLMLSQYPKMEYSQSQSLRLLLLDQEEQMYKVNLIQLSEKLEDIKGV